MTLGWNRIIPVNPLLFWQTGKIDLPAKTGNGSFDP
jgi:hypothetical protein